MTPEVAWREWNFRFIGGKDWFLSAICGVGEVGEMKRAEWSNQLNPEQLAARRMVSDRLRADRERHFTLNGIFYGLLVTGIGVAAAYALSRGEDNESPDVAVVGSGDTGPTAMLVTEAPTLIPSTFTPLPPTATFVPATETSTAEVLASPTATERVLDTEHGELFLPITCENISLLDCAKIIADSLAKVYNQGKFPLVAEGGDRGITYVHGESGLNPPQTDVETTINDDTYLGYFKLTYRSGSTYLSEPVLVFAYRRLNQITIIPGIPFDGYNKGSGNLGTLAIKTSVQEEPEYTYAPSQDVQTVINERLKPGQAIWQIGIADDVTTHKFAISAVDSLPDNHFFYNGNLRIMPPQLLYQFARPDWN